jgi:hypothetical protein
MCKNKTKKIRTGRKFDSSSSNNNNNNNNNNKEVTSKIVPVLNYAVGNERSLGNVKDNFTHSLSGL